MNKLGYRYKKNVYCLDHIIVLIEAVASDGICWDATKSHPEITPIYDGEQNADLEICSVADPDTGECCGYLSPSINTYAHGFTCDHCDQWNPTETQQQSGVCVFCNHAKVIL